MKTRGFSKVQEENRKHKRQILVVIQLFFKYEKYKNNIKIINQFQLSCTTPVQKERYFFLCISSNLTRRQAIITENNSYIVLIYFYFCWLAVNTDMLAISTVLEVTEYDSNRTEIYSKQTNMLNLSTKGKHLTTKKKLA